MMRSIHHLESQRAWGIDIPVSTPNIHGLLPEMLLAHLGEGATIGHARSLLASFLSFHPSARPRHSSVPKAIRARFEMLDFREIELVDKVEDPSDGFVKYLFRSPDGALSEAVRIPLEEAGRYTLCLSSQVGCGMGCVFCATGRLGFSRNLEPWEILSAFRRVRDELEPTERITGAVFMGQGEPLHNYDHVITAAKILSDPCGGRIKAEGISISTVGLVPEIRRYTAEGHRYRLVISMTSAISERRKRLLPVTRKWDLPELADAIRAYAEARRERVTIAWVLMAGENSGQDEVDALGRLLEGVPYKLNLIDVNADESDGFKRVDASELHAFRDRLRALGVPVVRRYSGGRERHAACGMLARTRWTASGSSEV
jgi:23S rRNA (adenine2503-C2)-methyltransferase